MNATVNGSVSQLPSYLWDGQLSLADESIEMATVPLEYTGRIALRGFCSSAARARAYSCGSPRLTLRGHRSNVLAPCG
jgi:hypothetical protein